MTHRIKHEKAVPVEKTPRGNISAKTKVEVVKRQSGRCYLCDELLLGKVEYDHEIPLALGGEDSIDNLRAIHPECHKDKTRLDSWSIAKAKRQGGEKGQPARRKKNGSSLTHPKLKKKINGEVVERD